MNEGRSNGEIASIMARGFAARARDEAYDRQEPGWGKHEPNRQEANHIVHAPLHEARDNLDRARELHDGVFKRK